MSPDNENDGFMAVGIKNRESVVLQFGKALSWVALTPDQAEVLGHLLIEQATLIREGRVPESGRVH